MKGSWTEYAVLWKTSFGFIWDIKLLKDLWILNFEFERKFDVQNSYFGGGYASCIAINPIKFIDIYI